MDKQNGTKLNKMLTQWPRGVVGIYSFFKQLNISPQLIAVYRKNGWVKKISSGAFARMDDKEMHWTGGLYAIQKYLDLPIHVGGITALEAAGYSHFVGQNERMTVWLYGIRGTKLPQWFAAADWKVTIRYRTAMLFNNVRNIGFAPHEIHGQSLVISTPERAIFEVLDLVSDSIDFEHAKNLMEGLNTLRPDIVQKLLEQCRSIKVKRLFLFLAGHCGHEWKQHLRQKKIYLGAGARSIAKHGVLDPEYKITIPLSCVKHNGK